MRQKRLDYYDPMSSEDPKQKATRQLMEALGTFETLSEKERVDVLVDGSLKRLVDAIAPTFAADATVYEYLLAHKFGLCLIAQLRLDITTGYSVRGKVNDQDVYVSPNVHQWFDDGVMFLQGRERFAGLIGLYQGGRLKFALAARDAQKGESLGKDDFIFVDVEDVEKQSPASLASLPQRRQAISDLEQLLLSREQQEAKYQNYFIRFPWVLGAQYRSIQSHEALDDRNIPDFTAVRLRDDARDIIEIKPPFLSLFRADGDLAADFNDAWNQAERYLDFCRREEDYLRRQKGLRFDNPHCFLLLGHGLTHVQLQRVRAKDA